MDKYECPVCLDDKVNMFTLPCTHKLCGDCLFKLENKSCPICRRNMLDDNSDDSDNMSDDMSDDTSDYYIPSPDGLMTEMALVMGKNLLEFAFRSLTSIPMNH